MIEARKNAAIERLFALINGRMLRSHFNRLMVGGSEHVQQLDRSVPIIFYGNHSCWWDGLIEFHLSKAVFGFDSYLMMDEEQMRRYRFFRWIGAFSVNRKVPREAALSVRYAADLLSRPNRVLWIYPQADMKPNDVRPLGFQSGIARIAASLGRVQLLPIAHRYEFMMEQRPEALALIGKPLILERVEHPKRLPGVLEETLTDLLDTLRSTVVQGRLDGFRVVLHGRSSTNVKYDAVRGLKTTS